MSVIISHYHYVNARNHHQLHTHRQDKTRAETCRAGTKITRKEEEYETDRKKKTEQKTNSRRVLISFVLTIATTNRTTKINIKINNDAAMRVLFCSIESDISPSLTSKSQQKKKSHTPSSSVFDETSEQR